MTKDVDDEFSKYVNEGLKGDNNKSHHHGTGELKIKPTSCLLITSSPSKDFSVECILLSSFIPMPSSSFSKVERTLSWTPLFELPSDLFPMIESISSRNIIDGAAARAFWKIWGKHYYIKQLVFYLNIGQCY